VLNSADFLYAIYPELARDSLRIIL